MSQEKLGEASTVLRDASESIGGETGERLESQAAALGDLAERENGPDHGRVARHQEKLREIKAASDEAGDAIDRAYELLNEYRETIEGV